MADRDGMMASLTFKKGERLKSSKVISALFTGDCPAVKAYPLIAVYKIIDEPRSEFPVQVAFSIPKRRIKSAVRRNKVRRRVKESYRFRKSLLYQDIQLKPDTQLAIMLIYVSNEVVEFNKIDRAIKKLVSKLIQELH